LRREEDKMKTLLTTTNEDVEISLIADNSLRGFNVRWYFEDKANPEKDFEYYAFPIMVNKIKAMDKYSKVTN
jgi:poly(3-hydroxyalkanoate) synthetase